MCYIVCVGHCIFNGMVYNSYAILFLCIMEYPTCNFMFLVYMLQVNYFNLVRFSICLCLLTLIIQNQWISRVKRHRSLTLTCNIYTPLTDRSHTEKIQLTRLYYIILVSNIMNRLIFNIAVHISFFAHQKIPEARNASGKSYCTKRVRH